MARRLVGGVAVALIAVSLLVVPSAGQTEARTLTITPNLDLVHDQSVVVAGQGWGAQQWLLLLVCREGALDGESCEVVRDFRTSSTGAFQRSINVDVILDLQAEAVDCRLETCEVVVIDNYPPGNLRRVALAFDPGGPDPGRYPATATPDTGLVDGQTVQVEADGLPVEHPVYGTFVSLVQCGSAVPSAGDCDWSTYEYRPGDTAGHLDAPFVVSTVLYPEGGGTVDCRVATCTIAVYTQRDSLSDAGLAPTAFDPGGVLRPPPTLTVTPVTDLRDGDLVHLEGDGFEPGGTVSIAQCLTGAQDHLDCRFDPGYLDRADANGHVDGYFGLYAIIRLADSRADCRLAECSIVMSDDTGFGPFIRYDEVATPFDPDAPLLDAQVTVTPSTDLVDGSVVTVSGTGFHPTDGVIAQLCPVGADWFDQCSFDVEQYFDVTDVESTPRREMLGPPVPPELAASLLPPERATGRRQLRVADSAEAASDQDFSGSLELTPVFTDFDGRRTDCRTEPCMIMVFEAYNEGRQVHVPVEFARADDGTGGASGPIAGAPGFTG